jgi:hypothetical protein
MADPALHLLSAAEHALRSYENGNTSPELAREVAEAIAAFRSGADSFVKPVLLVILENLAEPSDAMLDAGVAALEAAPELDARDFVRLIVGAVATAGFAERPALRGLHG